MSKTTTVTKSLLLVAGICVALVPATSFAKGEGRGHGPRVSFEALDTDQSGEITAAELAAHAATRFADRDTDGDGFLTKEELSADAEGRRAKRVERMFERRDANADGKLSIDEITPDADRIAKRFERADTDQSGGISKEEFENASKKRGGRNKRSSK